MSQAPPPPAPYTAAGNGQRLKLFRPSNHGPNSAMAALTTMQARSRHVSRNDPWAVSAANKSVANGIGCGIQTKQVWGTAEFKTQVRDLSDLWIPFADADGVYDWYGLQALVWREWHEAGECFVRLRSRRPADNLPVPLQLQVLESEQCPYNYYATAPGSGNAIRCGIEFNGIGKRVAYWMYSAHPGDGVFSQIDGNRLRRIPAEQILHLFMPTRAGQIRGVPVSAPVLADMFNRTRLDDAVMERQQVGNLYGGFFTRAAETSDQFGDVVAGMQTDTDTDGTPIAGLEPGTMQELPPGYDVKFSAPPGPGTDYIEFMRQRLMAIAAAYGVPYEVLTGDLRGISDRALKLILAEFRRDLEMQLWLALIPQICQPVRAAFMDAAVLAGKLIIPGYADIRASVVRATHVPQGWPYSHPVQDVSADLKAIKGGLTSRSKVVTSNGEDVEEIDAEQQADHAREDAAGLKYDSRTIESAQDTNV